MDSEGKTSILPSNQFYFININEVPTIFKFVGNFVSENKEEHMVFCDILGNNYYHIVDTKGNTYEAGFEYKLTKVPNIKLTNIKSFREALDELILKITYYKNCAHYYNFVEQSKKVLDTVNKDGCHISFNTEVDSDLEYLYGILDTYTNLINMDIPPVSESIPIDESQKVIEIDFKKYSNK